MVFLVVPAVRAQDGEQWARESLSRRTDLPWYSPSDDALQEVERIPRQDDPNRGSQWEAETQQPTTRAWNWRLPAWFLLVLEIVAWLLLCTLLGLLAWLLFRTARRGSLLGRHATGIAEDEMTAESRIEQLPIAIAPEHHDLLAAARAFYAAGDFARAIIYAFAHQLVELDKHHLIHLSQGKTNRQYLLELKKHPAFIELVRPMMLAFEEVFFGHHELPLQRYQSCWSDLDRFHQQLQQVAP